MHFLVAKALNKAKKLTEPTNFTNKPEEYLWDKVCRERKEGNRKYLGGNYRHFEKATLTEIKEKIDIAIKKAKNNKD